VQWTRRSSGRRSSTSRSADLPRRVESRRARLREGVGTDRPPLPLSGCSSSSACSARNLIPSCLGFEHVGTAGVTGDVTCPAGVTSALCCRCLTLTLTRRTTSAAGRFFAAGSWIVGFRSRFLRKLCIFFFHHRKRKRTGSVMCLVQYSTVQYSAPPSSILNEKKKNEESLSTPPANAYLK
jgi:hypothetical protein